LAIDEQHLSIDKKTASKAILRGYNEGILSNGKPFVLEENNKWLRNIALSELKEPDPFWKRLSQLPDLSQILSKDITELLLSTLPENLSEYKIAHRVAGIGSLGHQRYVIIGNWNGSKIGREVKAIIPSAFVWANKSKQSKLYYNDILKKAIRCPDPFIKLHENWLSRRISPHCSRIELYMLPALRDEKKLLIAMGHETANIHLGTSKVLMSIKETLEQLPKNWLHETSLMLAEQVKKDWKKSQ
jgi:hypothetical protein